MVLLLLHHGVCVVSVCASRIIDVAFIYTSNGQYKTEAAMRKGLLTAIHYGMVGILNT